MNKKEIFKKAWEIRKEAAAERQSKVSEISMSECLKIAYFQHRNTTIEYINKTIATVEFLAVNVVKVDIKNNDAIVTMYFVINNDNVYHSMKCVDGIEVHTCTKFQKVKVETIKKYKELVALELMNDNNIYQNKDKKCDCSKCEISHICNYKNKFQRLSREKGGLEMCLKLDNVRMKNYIVRNFQDYLEIVEKLK